MPLLQHVKGHQDDSTPVEFLELPSQLNVEADALATMDLQEYGTIKSHVPFDPGAGIQLTIGSRTVTRQTMKVIHNQHHLAPIRQYYRSRFQWSAATFDQIDWVQYTTAYCRFSCQRTFFSKLG
jgi:hypothetical protein